MKFEKTNDAEVDTLRVTAAEMLPPYSVLMSVYKKEKPEYFMAACESMLSQSVQPQTFVLVCDGPLTPELDEAVAHYEAYPFFRICRLPENRGLGSALSEGLRLCDTEYVARMDSDDISFPNRIAAELRFMEDNSLDLCSADVSEFSGSPDNVTAERVLPGTDAEIRAYAKKRNPINHPAAVFRRSAVIKAGGYLKMPFFEDYWLWIRMLMCGATAGNVQEPLLYMRADSGMYKRRGGAGYAAALRNFWKAALGVGFISRTEYVKNLAVRCTVALMPDFLRNLFYMKFLRKQR